MAKLLFIITFLTGTCFSGYCQENNSFYPLTSGTGKNFSYYNTPLRLYYSGPVEKNKKLYIKESRKYKSGGISDTLLRVSNDTVYVYSESQNREMPFFGIRPVKGEKIGYGKIIKTNANLKTPSAKYTNLLQVKITIPANEIWNRGIEYTLYLQKGIGLVAIERYGRLDEYLIE